MDNKVVLYVEDDALDVSLCRQTVRKIAPELDVRYVHDGDVAMEWLDGDGAYADRSAFPMPAIVVTDLKMLHVSGVDLLRWIRGQPRLKKLPVVIHTGSPLSEDMRQCEMLGAFKYLVKTPLCLSLVEFLRDYFNGGKVCANST